MYVCVCARMCMRLCRLSYHVLEAGGSSKQMALADCDGTHRERKKERKDISHSDPQERINGGKIKVSYSINDL